MNKRLTAQIVKKLQALGSPENVAGMARFGIVAQNAFGVSAPARKQLAREIKGVTHDRHGLALALWETGVHEARALAYLIDDPRQVTQQQMESWVRDFDNWAICDGTCGHLFCRTAFAYDKAFAGAECEAEFMKRAGLVLMAWLAVHDKKADDAKIARFLPILESKADDDRNFVKKAVNWSLRQIGKRNLPLNRLAIATAEKMLAQKTRSARWIATNALRELKDETVRKRLRDKADRRSGVKC
ncbi:MAG: DNA alkylation repair protein [Chthoniobacterales bacterium]|nr:DNA alkylation repair protein [Chthoniobacterales bacterium]